MWPFKRKGFKKGLTYTVTVDEVRQWVIDVKPFYGEFRIISWETGKTGIKGRNVDTPGLIHGCENGGYYANFYSPNIIFCPECDSLLPEEFVNTLAFAYREIGVAHPGLRMILSIGDLIPKKEE